MEPLPVRFEGARTRFANWDEIKCKKGISQTTDVATGQTEWTLCVEVDDSGQPDCPLGYMLHERSRYEKVGDLRSVSLNGRNKRAYVVSGALGKSLLDTFMADVKDPRPIVSTQKLVLEASCDADFTICLSVYVYYHKMS